FSCVDSLSLWQRRSRAESLLRSREQSFLSTRSSTVHSAITRKCAKLRWIGKETSVSSLAESVSRISRPRSTTSLSRSTSTQIGSMLASLPMPECPLFPHSFPSSISTRDDPMHLLFSHCEIV
ncbi:hypothetical protein PFISCL1PPCAC_6270, partial [Pristionchus fissidentatus]